MIHNRDTHKHLNILIGITLAIGILGSMLILIFGEYLLRFPTSNF